MDSAATLRPPSIGLNPAAIMACSWAATNPPLAVTSCLRSSKKRLFWMAVAYELSANQYSDVIHPQGFVYQQEFRLDPFPVFTYSVAGLEIEKSVCMVQNQSTAVIRYAFATRTSEPLPPCLCEIRPLIAFADFHSLTQQNPACESHVDQQPGRVSIHPYAICRFASGSHCGCHRTSRAFVSELRCMKPKRRAPGRSEDL